MIVSEYLAGVVASAIAGLGGLRNRGGRPFCGSRTATDRELTMVSSAVTVDWPETRKYPVGAFSLLPGRGLCQVLAKDGVDRIVGYRAFLGVMGGDRTSRGATAARLAALTRLDRLAHLREITQQQDSFNTDVIAVYQ